MNDNHIQQIFLNYIKKFEEINDSLSHREYYKWEIVKKFKPMMDEALSAPTAEFAGRLKDLKKLSLNLIDSYTQPFGGLVTFAEQEPETVRKMFQDLYMDDGGNLKERQKRIVDFLQRSHALRDKYAPNSYRFKDDFHSVTGYLFLYDPDHNYIFKASHALMFADCIEFYDDWGSGENVKLDVYYRMCDQLAEEIKKNDALMKTDAERFENKLGIDSSKLYADPEKHILAFDIIYCCSAYGLFSGISFNRPKSKARSLMQERKTKAVMLYEKLNEAKEQQQKLEQAIEYVNSIYTPGTMIHHKKYGEGIVKNNTGAKLIVDFKSMGEKQLGTFSSAANDIITVDKEEYTIQIEKYREYLKRERSIKTALSYAETEFAQYAELLD